MGNLDVNPGSTYNTFAGTETLVMRGGATLALNPFAAGRPTVRTSGSALGNVLFAGAAATTIDVQGQLRTATNVNGNANGIMTTSQATMNTPPTSHTR